MYPVHSKAEAKVGKTAAPDSCYAERARGWLWALAVIAVGATVYLIGMPSDQNAGGSPTGPSPGQRHLQAQNVALVRCPYCPGFLDVEGRCNVSGCPIYSPNWGRKSSELQNTSQLSVLVKELAIEVKPLEGGQGVKLHSVYIGGGADQAGLRPGDMIYRFNGRRVKDIEQFQSLVAQAKAESNAEIRVIRNKKRTKALVMIGEGEMEGVTIPNAVNPVQRSLRGR